MQHPDHVELIRRGVDPAGGGRWVDLGAGEGAFTLALADLLGRAAVLVAVDRDAAVLDRLQRAIGARFPDARLTTLVADLGRPLPLEAGSADGVLAANSLHFLADRSGILGEVRRVLRPGGTLVVVEYDTDHSNPWVPHPFSFGRWERMAGAAGFGAARLVGRVPSRFLGSIDAAAAERPATAGAEVLVSPTR